MENFLAKLIAKIIKEEIIEKALLIKINFREKELNSFHRGIKSIEESKKKLGKISCELERIKQQKKVTEEQAQKDLLEIKKILEDIENLKD